MVAGAFTAAYLLGDMFDPSTNLISLRGLGVLGPSLPLQLRLSSSQVCPSGESGRVLLGCRAAHRSGEVLAFSNSESAGSRWGGAGAGVAILISARFVSAAKRSCLGDSQQIYLLGKSTSVQSKACSPTVRIWVRVPRRLFPVSAENYDKNTRPLGGVTHYTRRQIRTEGLRMQRARSVTGTSVDTEPASLFPTRQWRAVTKRDAPKRR